MFGSSSSSVPNEKRSSSSRPASPLSIDEKAAALSSKERLSSLTEKELLLELQVINLGYRDAFVHATSNGVEVTVISDDVSATKANEIILMTLSSFDTEASSVVVNFSKLEDFQ